MVLLQNKIGLEVVEIIGCKGLVVVGQLLNQSLLTTQTVENLIENNLEDQLYPTKLEQLPMVTKETMNLKKNQLDPVNLLEIVMILKFNNHKKEILSLKITMLYSMTIMMWLDLTSLKLKRTLKTKMKLLLKFKLRKNQTTVLTNLKTKTPFLQFKLFSPKMILVCKTNNQLNLILQLMLLYKPLQRQKPFNTKKLNLAFRVMQLSCSHLRVKTQFNKKQLILKLMLKPKLLQQRTMLNMYKLIYYLLFRRIKMKISLKTIFLK